MSSDYNTTRHAGVMAALYALGRIGAADAALGYVRENLISQRGWTAFAPPGESVDVGANSLLVVALMNRRKATGERRYDRLARRIGRFLVFQLQADGSILQYYQRYAKRASRRVREVCDRRGLLRPGPAGAGVSSEGWDEPAHRVADYSRRAATRSRAGSASPTTGRHTGSRSWALRADRDRSRVRALARGLLRLPDPLRVAARGQRLNRLSESGSSLGTDGEAAAALWRLAGAEPRLADLHGRLGDRVSCNAGVLVDRQVSAVEQNRLARGAWFDDGYTQMDDQQHAIAALLGAREVLR